MNHAKKFRDLSEEELIIDLDKQRKDLFQLVNLVKSSKKKERLHEIVKGRRDVARILTVINERKRSSK